VGTVLLAADLSTPPALSRAWQEKTNSLDGILFLVPILLVLTVVVLGIATIVIASRQPARRRSAERVERQDRGMAA
jgi:hypothetical protein